MPSSAAICSARLGPTPGTLDSSLAPGGTLARSSSRAANVPARRMSAILPAIDDPTPGILVRPASGSDARSPGYPPTDLAARS